MDNINEIPLIKLEYGKQEQNICRRVLKTLQFYFVCLFIYLEVVFHLVRFGFEADNIIQKLLFAIIFGLIVSGFVSLFNEMLQKILSVVVTALVCTYFVIQVIYSGVFSTYLSASGSIGVAGQAFDFTDVIVKELRHEWWIIALLILPIVLYAVIGIRKISYTRYTLVVYGLSFAGALVCLTITMVVLSKDDNALYTSYEVYRDYTSVDMAVEQLGVSEAFVLDAKYAVADKLGIHRKQLEFVAEEAIAQTEIVARPDCSCVGNILRQKDENGVTLAKKLDAGDVYDISPNVLDIDMDELIEKETNQNIAAIHEYVKSVTPTNKNKYTGMFEDYNLIFVVAEGFSGYVIDPKLTPTLYKMSHKGFCFNNYYTPLWYGSTLGGEYADLTGLMPKNGGYLSMGRAGSRGNDMMFTLSRQLLKKGYTVTGFHNNDYTYYDRHISHTNMGYNWIGVGNGYVPEKSQSGVTYWPQSDLNMIETTFDIYKDSLPFHTYYLTVSGHVMYNFGGNAMAARHKDYVEKLDYSETTKAYIACQYELELALTRLNEKLEEAGIADKTLIVVTADHVPYDNKEVVDELAGKTLDSTFEWYKNTLIIYSASMEEPVDVGKYCSSLDVLPTISNLMGLDYDSRMLAGQDILSDAEGLVMFNDRSFITDRCSYNANTGEVKSLDGKAVDDEYVQQKIAQIKNKFSFAENVCNLDYYRYIDEAYYGESE